jgi:DNA-binding response OmpR family regulator
MKKPSGNCKILLVHWNKEEADALAAILHSAGWDVAVEHGAGRFKMSELKQKMLGAVVISLRRLPSHGREVAQAFWSTKWGRDIPIIFFDGAPEKAEPLRAKFPAAHFTRWENLPAVLNDL